MLRGILFHLSKDGVALRKHRIEVIINRSGCREVVVPPTWRRRFFLAWSHTLPFQRNIYLQRITLRSFAPASSPRLPLWELVFVAGSDAPPARGTFQSAWEQPPSA